jgi:MFS transporter, CP family, cyanate transporter
MTARSRPLLLIAGMMLVAINLRPTLASVGPLVEPIRAATGLSAAAFGLLTTLPLIAFGVVSTLAPFVTRRLGLGGALALALALILAGTAARPLAGVALLFLGTGALGVGIALGNVLLPALVKRDFAGRSGALTSLYSSVMGIGAMVAAGVSVPLAQAIGWRASLGVWAVPAAIALALWLPRVRRRTPAATGAGADVASTGAQNRAMAAAGSDVATDAPSSLAALRSLGRSPLAWQVALFMGFQSVTFYVLLTWLPDLLQSRGLGAAAAGGLLALAQATGIVGSAVVPLWASRTRDQRRIIVMLGGLEVISLLGLLPSHVGALAVIWVGVIGFVMGGTFGLALLFLVVRAPDTHMATNLSGMAQSVGYLIAAAGPALIGLVRDMTGGWTVPLLCLLAVLAAKVASGLGAARDRVVGA